MSILVFNAGSSSLKFGLFDAEARRALASGGIDWADGDRQHAKLVLHAEPDRQVRATVSRGGRSNGRATGDWPLEEADAGQAEPAAAIEVVGHRVVHGGVEFARQCADRRAGEGGHRPPGGVGPAAQSARAGGDPGRGSRPARRSASSRLRHGLLCPPAAQGACLSAALPMVRGVGRAAVRLPRDQPPVLHPPRRRVAGAGTVRAAHRELPPGRRLFRGGRSRRRGRRHDHGLHDPGRPDDGHPLRLDRSGDLAPPPAAAAG